jgi:pSer/pThr/pTyr-binding forkhead associated (FHA) protein
MKLSLVVLTSGKSEGKKIPIPQTEFLIGRDPKCHLRPVSPMISKRHCALIVRGDQVFIRDFKSTNGTFVNDQQVDGELELKHGDRLTVGPLRLSIDLEAGTPVDKRTPVPPTKVPARAEEEDHAAAVLLALQDEGTTVQETAGVGSQEAATGSTILQSSAAPEAPEAEKEKEAASKLEQVKKNQANTSSAASRILDKYIRRPRF